MDNLQKLLDERWPLTDDLGNYDIQKNKEQRELFTEGYNEGYTAWMIEVKELPTLEPIPQVELQASLDTLERLKNEFKTP